MCDLVPNNLPYSNQSYASAAANPVTTINSNTMNGNYSGQSQLQQHHHHHHHHHGHGAVHQHHQQVTSPVNARANKLVADYKQIILELRTNFLFRFFLY
jgi:hypothetical protein